MKLQEMIEAIDQAVPEKFRDNVDMTKEQLVAALREMADRIDKE